MSKEPDYPEGVKKYIKLAREGGAEQERYIRDVVKKWRFDTVAVHGMYSMQEALQFNQGAIIEPMYMSSSQAYWDSDHMEAGLAYLVPNWCYSRIANPSMYYYEWVLGLMEGYGCDELTDACATASGMAAIMSATEPFLTKRTKKGDEKINFVATCQVYGGTFQQFAERKPEHGVECRWVRNSHDLSEWESKIDENTRFLYGELPSNPGQAFFDLDAVIELAHSHGIPMIVDNTVATPALLRPLARGADIVVQSATKTLTSSGFGIAGAIISRRNITADFDCEPMLRENFAQYVKFLPNRDNGPSLSPLQCVLSISDMRTLRSKVDLMSRNSMKVAEWLEKHPKVKSVNYLGLESHPLHELAKKYLVLVDSELDGAEPVHRYGHLLGVTIDGTPQDTRDFFDALEMIWRATDLGRIKSVATIPSISTHQQQGEEGREIAQIPPQMVRLCVGGEHPDDVIADLDQALACIGNPKAKPLARHPIYFSTGGGAGRDILKD
jgi:O-acetylhomoserine/O-acetylserine sulfhydrylase-like pyridoxal-dependent enzyme